MKQAFLNLPLLIFLTMAAAPLSAWANNCQQAEQLFKQSQRASSTDQQIHLLTEATRLCSTDKKAHYHLAQLMGNNGNLAEAERLYQIVLKIDPNFTPAYAKLGDVLMKREDYHQAANRFGQFVTLANNEPRFQPQLNQYEKRLKKAQEEMIASSIDSMFNNLTPLKSGLGRPPEHDIPMRFKPGSHEIMKNGTTWKQCQKIAGAIRKIFKIYKNSVIRIEGHTDDVKSNYYSDILSHQRALSVKEVLVNDFQVANKSLVVLGMGENYPKADNKTRHGRFQNNRIRLIRIDR